MKIAEIKVIMTNDFIANETIKSRYGLVDGRSFEAQFSKLSIESILFSVIAICFWAITQLFDLHIKEVTVIIDNLKPHTARWYANMSKLFQYGHNLLPDSDQYDNSALIPEKIDESRIVTYAAVVEQSKKLIIKVAKTANSDLAALNSAELTAFGEYIRRVKDAGVHIELISYRSDDLRLKLTIYYNPLILDREGRRLDGTSDAPVADAIRNYLRNLPFNGWYVPAYMTDTLQQIEGVIIPAISLSQYKYAELLWTDTGDKYQPYAGYLRMVDADLEIEYIPQGQIL